LEATRLGANVAPGEAKSDGVCAPNGVGLIRHSAAQARSLTVAPQLTAVEGR
jgi:hypothetical protein